MLYTPDKSHPYFFSLLKRLGTSILLMLFIMGIARLIYAFLFLEPILAKNYLGLTLRAIFLGFRYDLIAISYVVLLPFLLTWTVILNPRGRWMTFVAHFNRWWIFCLFTLITILLVCDLGFYSYFQDHINVLFFGLFEDDTQAVLTTIWKNYNVPLWGSLIFLTYFLLWKLLKRVFTFTRIDLNYMRPWEAKKLSILFVITLITLIFFARGNFTRLPLSIEDSRIGPIPSINHLSLNGVIALNRAIRIRNIYGKDNANYLRKNGYKNIEGALADLDISGASIEALKKITPLNLEAKNNPPHVILVVVESLGAYWWNLHNHDFNFLASWEQHLKEDNLQLNMMPSDNGTIGSITSIISGLPLRPGSRVLSEGRYMKVPLPSAIHRPFVENGYETTFLYGGKLGWRQLGDYLNVQKYDHIEGGDEIKKNLNLEEKYKPSDIGNEWGVFDEYLFSYMKLKMKNAQKPQFFLILTTSNHPPFEVPSHYKPLDIKLTTDRLKLFSKSADEVHQRFKTLQYSNAVIGDFLTDIKQGELKENVVVGVTGDHSFWISKKVDDHESIPRYRVPFYLYLPTRLRKVDFAPTLMGSHIDIAPTLYHLTLSETSYWGFGRPIYENNAVGINPHLTANKDAISFEGKNFCHRLDSFPIVEPCTENSNHQKIQKYRNALMSLTDEFLRAQVK